MAVGSYPNSLNTAPVCSPSVGPPSSKSPGMAESFGTAPGSGRATGPNLNSRFLRILWLLRRTPADSFGCVEKLERRVFWVDAQTARYVAAISSTEIEPRPPNATASG